MKKIQFISMLFLAVAIGFSSCGTKQEEQTHSIADDEGKPKVRLQEVTKRDVPQTADFTATVQPEIKNNITSQSPGRIRKLMVEVGDNVKKGQKLAQMDDANLANTRTQINNMRTTYNRVAELYEVGGASQQELDNAKLQLDIAEINMKNLEENTSLISPIDGIVTARNYDEGDMYNGQVPVFTVMQISPLKLIINVSESYYAKVKKGMTVDVKFDVFGDEVFEGTVNLIYPTIDEMTRTFTTEITLPNKDLRVRPGMFGRVTINFGVENRVVVPDQAIVKQPGSGERFVYVYKNGKVSYDRVELGRRFGNEYELISGVESGSQVVVAGQTRLANGAEVEIIK
ncbi:efflux RND transporter periplasmic adaptor subunit [Paludibacter sp. 221]|uniref:efflux RND transporter periplasmic adaptor subunit n=1 Tax=Paludibacter sp. 221 TaxID=2302939 RepID=UPI0013D2E070|nr:efflux RND transporter periplasmic adaptor subunit [Paludibacter sp. 221]NDV46662.1 efflux RND transporter periplasmic adaptor subunit [Paludibacter sp. 221]